VFQYSALGRLLGKLVETMHLKLTHNSMMKTLSKTKPISSRIEAKNLTLGGLIAATYDACGEKGASKLLQLAMETQVIKYSQPF
jgi:hypothetical protein